MPPRRCVQIRSADGTSEWTVLELQGSLSTKESCLDALPLGTLQQTPQGTISLQIGMQIMYGSWVKLKKPLTVLRKDNLAEATDEDTAAVDYSAVGVIRQKLVFKARPMPISRPLAPLADAKRVRTN